MEVHVVKLDQTENSTVSRMFIDNKFVCFIIEDGERQAKIHSSTRIPAGSYTLVKDTSSRFVYHYGYCWWVKDVPGFSEIKIHKGNTIYDTAGCLLPNHFIGFNGDNYFGSNSFQAYNLMMSILAKEPTHQIHIIR